ncbi:MAG: FHA domain-containing protein [Actinomycetota bacterium]
MPTLNIVSGPAAGRQFEVTTEQVLGREGADITVMDPEISRSHARLRPHDEGIEVHDLGSSNGTFVNDIRIAGPTVIRPGDRVRFGGSAGQVVNDRSGTMISPPGAVVPASPSAAPPPVSAPTAPQQPVGTGPMGSMQPGPATGPYPGSYAPPPKNNSKTALIVIAAVAGVLVLVVVALFALGTLGGGGVEKDEVIAEGDEICNDAGQELVGFNGQQPGEFVANFAGLTEGVSEDLRAIGTPDEDADVFESYLETLDDSARIMRETVPAAEALDQQGIDVGIAESAEVAEDSARLATDFGFEVCREFELTPTG